MQDKHLPRIAIICVNYENRAEGLRFLQALSDLNLSVIDVFMVDNSEKEKFNSKDLLALPWAKLLSNGQNLGYWGAFMVGLKEALLQTTPYDWIVLSNPDITFDPDFFDQLLKRKLDGMQVIAPSICSGISQRDQNPFMKARPSSRKLRFYKLIFSNLGSFIVYDFLSQLKKKYQSQKSIKSKVHEGDTFIFAPHGSLIIFSLQAAQSLLSATTAPFLFCEEIFLGEHCRNNKIPIQYSPDLKATHRESTTMRFIPSAKIVKYKSESMQLIYRNHFK